jgi:hypothetical protein
MPTISAFYGIIIQMFWADRAPPRFHALYSEFEALIAIQTLEVYQGNLPRRALALVLEWAAQHRAELMEDWKLCAANRTPLKIAPLE